MCLLPRYLRSVKANSQPVGRKKRSEEGTYTDQMQPPKLKCRRSLTAAYMQINAMHGYPASEHTRRHDMITMHSMEGVLSGRFRNRSVRRHQ